VTDPHYGRRSAPWALVWATLVALLGACSSDAVRPDADSTVAPDTAEGVDDVDDAGDTDDSVEPRPDTEPDADTSPPADADVAPDTSPPEDTTPQPDAEGPPQGFPAAELVVRIVEPGGHGSAPAVGSTVRLAGLLFGEADALSWTMRRADGLAEEGAISLGAFWQSGPIAMSPGDNTLTVLASRGGHVVTDDIVVTYNPAFRFDDALEARPRVLWVDQETDVVFTIPSSLYSNADKTTLRLVRANAHGNVLEDVGPMRDDGAVTTSGDEIASDAVFTFRKAFTCATTEPLFFRASVTLTGAVPHTALSPTLRVDCLSHVLGADCDAHKALLDAAAADLADGSGLDAVRTQLESDPSVKAAGRAAGGGTSLWVQFADGLLGAVLAGPMGQRGGGPDGYRAAAPSGAMPHALSGTFTHEIGSKRAIVLAPFASEFGLTDDGADVAASIVSHACPAFELAGGTVLRGANASLSRFRDLATYGVASISSHGEALFGDLPLDDMAGRYLWRHHGSQEVLWTGSPVACADLVQEQEPCTVDSATPTGGCPPGTRCLVTQSTVSAGEASGSGLCLDETQVDLRLGRVVLTNRGYAVTPAFFTAYRGRGYPQSLINLGACRTFYNGSFAAALYASGARAITGFSDYVSSSFAREKVLELFDDFGGGGVLGQHFRAAEDPEHPGAYWRFFGATNLDVSQAEIVNGDFETGDTIGWTAHGDGRVVTQLGSTTAVGGKFVGLVSSGLGFTVEEGTLEQTFCIPADKVQIEFYWKMFSEEFKEFCGEQY